MSLTRLLKNSVKLFQKDIISFLIIRRHDLGVSEDKLRYLAVRPNASTAVLRHKVWYLLDLPDFCEEVILLKNHKEIEIPLAALRKGNDPTHPYILEVYPPEKHRLAPKNILANHMLTMGNEAGVVEMASETSYDVTNCKSEYNGKCVKVTSETPISQHHRTLDNNRAYTVQNCADCTKSEISHRISSCSLISKLNGRKSRDNLANVLLKLQSDLSNLSSKLSTLETKVQPTLN